MASRPSSGPSRAVNMLEAKTHLSRMVEAIETGAEAEVGIARREFVAPDSIDRANPLIAHLFEQLPLHHRGPPPTPHWPHGRRRHPLAPAVRQP